MIEQREKLQQRMDGTTVAKVAHYGDAQAVDAASAGTHFLAYRVEVEQRLARMFVGPVAAVDHRYPGRSGELGHGPLLGVAHDDHIAVAREHTRGVVQGLALGERRRLDLGGFADVPAKQIEGGAEGHPGPGAGLEEHVGKDGTLKNPRNPFALGKRSEVVGDFEEPVDIAGFELVDRENVTADEVQGCLRNTRRVPWKRHSSSLSDFSALAEVSGGVPGRLGLGQKAVPPGNGFCGPSARLATREAGIIRSARSHGAFPAWPQR